MSDDGWIAESVVQFTRSPLWSTPVNNFIDDNCWIFDDGEMLVEQTEIHIKFRQLIDTLLTEFVGDIGIALENVLKAVEEAVDGSSAIQAPAERFLNYIFYVDDFSSFHKMMSKRNVELDILASRQLQSRSGNDNNGAPMASERGRELNDDDAILLAIAASLNDEVIMRKELEIEDLQIQEALALSISAENEHMRRAALAVTEEMASHPPNVSPSSIEQVRKEKLIALEEERAQNIMKLEARALEVRQEALLRGITAVRALETTTEPPPAEKAPAKEEKPIAQTIAPAQSATAPESPAITPAASGKAKVQIVPPRPGVAKLYGLKPLPSIQPSFKQLQAMAENSATGVLGSETASATTAKLDPAAPALQAMAQNSATGVLGSGKTSAAMAKINPADPAYEEMQARAKYMREQREKIIALNKASRDKELTEYAAKAKSNPSTSEPQKQEKQMTVDLARRLREDIVREATK